MAETLTKGYYWYISADGDFGDLETDEPQIVYVDDDFGIQFCGGDVSVPVEDAHGRFIGPLVITEVR